jgi:hypothetical protein
MWRGAIVTDELALDFAILGQRRPAHTLVACDAVCADHVKLRVDSESLALAIREVRADIGERPLRPNRQSTSA